MKPLRYSLLALLPVFICAATLAQAKRTTKDWPTASPSAVGIDEKVLDALDAEIADGRYGYVDGMLVIRHGKLVYDRSYKVDYDSAYKDYVEKPGALNAHDPSGQYNYFNPWWHPFYRRGDLHSLQSVTKTITSVIIGVATQRGDFPSVETPVLSFFDTARVANIDGRKRRMTIRHLLTMSDGFDWNESLPYEDPNNAAVTMEASCDWIEFVINRPMANEPGTVFNYNSGASMLLSYIFRIATGMDVEEYAAKHLFGPLGIDQFYWKRTPTGLPDTEGGLYLRAHDLAKIWYLFLMDGVWEGKQVVGSDWVKASVTPHITVSQPGVKYGYKWWLTPYGSDSTRFAWAGSGFGGQIPIAIQEYDLIIVFTGWNILQGTPRLPSGMARDRILSAIEDGS